MALFHDPLDDLIEGLERAVPAEPAAVECDQRDYPPGPDIQAVIGIVLKGSKEELESLNSEPRYMRVVEYLRNPHGYRCGSSGPASSDRTS